MKRKVRNSNFTRRALLAALALVVLGLASGCYVVEDDPYYHEPGIFLGDLEVNWRVDGSQSTTRCDAYGIYRWVVSVRGPESRDVVLDCRADWWSTENDLLDMYEGRYAVTVEAEDIDGYLLAGQSSSVDLMDRGNFVDTLTFQFYPQDFGY